jgi:hypothetical protein
LPRYGYRMRTVRTAALLALVAGLCGGGATAQAPAAFSGLDAVPLQGLAFGSLLPGVPEVVTVTDAARRAEIVLNGSGLFDVTLVLPDAMVSSTGARMPLRFGAGDGALLRNVSAAPAAFDPLGTNRLRLDGTQGPARLLLGGTALPSREQTAGRYTTTIVVVITNPGT